MGLIEFELRSLDSLIQSPERTEHRGAGVTFRRLGEIECSPAPDLFREENETTSEARRLFTVAASQAHGFPIGDVSFGDVFLAGPRGLVIDRERRVVWHGDSINWALESVRMDVVGNLAGEMPDDDTVLLDDRLFTLSKADRAGDRDWPRPWLNDPLLDLAPQSFAHLHLLALPGFAIYGHWLVDVLPRVVRIASGEVPGARIYAPSVHDWAVRFGRMLGLDLAGNGLGRVGSLVHAERVDVQTAIKRARVLDRGRAETAWSALVDALGPPAGDDDVAGYGRRLYVSRANWTSGRALANHSEVEEHMRRRGFSVVHPERLSLEAQRVIFSRANRVVGEDGSGLHNIVFAEPGLELTVIDLHRTNVFHASIANAKRHRLSHLASDEVQDRWHLPLDRLDEHLDQDVASSQ